MLLIFKVVVYKLSISHPLKQRKLHAVASIANCNCKIALINNDLYISAVSDSNIM